MLMGVGVHADLKIDRRCLFVVLESRGRGGNGVSLFILMNGLGILEYWSLCIWFCLVGNCEWCIVCEGGRVV